MSWPDTDVQTYRMVLGETWFYHDSLPPAGVSGRAGFGWTVDPFHAFVDGAEQPVISHLLSFDAAVTARFGSFMAIGEGSGRGAWEGSVGISSPRVGAAWSSEHATVVGRWTIPVSTFDALLAAPSSVFDLTVSGGDSRWRGALGAVYRQPLGDLWRPSVTASAGIGLTDHWTLEAKAEGWPGFLRAEAGTQYRIAHGAAVSALAVAVGLTDTPGSPRLRVNYTVSLAKRPAPPPVLPPLLPVPAVPEIPAPSGPAPLDHAEPVTAAEPAAAAEPVPPSIPTEVPPQPSPIAPVMPTSEPPPAPPALDHRYNDVFEAAADYFKVHPTFRFILETNGTKAQAERIVYEMQQRGILRERVVRIDYVKRKGPVTFEFIVVGD